MIKKEDRLMAKDLPRYQKIGETEASQDITGGQIDVDKMQSDVQNKLDSMLPLYKEDSAVKKIDKIDNKHPEFDYIYLPAALGAKAVDGYGRLYNYIANLINSKKIDDANELLDAIQEIKISNRDLSNKENKNGK